MHVIVGLNVGGAELMLKRLILQNTEGLNETVVVSLTSLGVIGESLRKNGVCVHALEMSSVRHFPITLWRLIRLVRQYRPAIVHTWMYHADLLGGLAARLAGSSTVIWCIRCTTIPQGPLSLTYWLVRLCALLSYCIPRRIICCAHAAKDVHVKLGYAVRKMAIIPNGYDFTVFDGRLGSRDKARIELGLSADEIVIGTVGRFDPIKDYHNFVTAASTVAAERSNIKFLMVGRENEWSNDSLRGWIESKRLKQKFVLTGQQLNVAHFFSAMDIFCLSSACGEGFPNALAEAMAMGLPCVVTRVGDAAEILGCDDFVVPVKDSASLADALLRMCNLTTGDRKNPW